MTAFASTDVTVTVLKRGLLGRDKIRRCTVVFGNSALTTPATGVPLPAANVFGLSRILDMMISPNETGYVYKYDSTNHSIRIYQGVSGSVALTGDALATHVHDMTFIGGIATTEAVMIAGGDTLGKNAATNRTILGADVATKGGVKPVTAGTPSGTVDLTAAPLSHVATNHAPAATTLIVYAVGR